MRWRFAMALLVVAAAPVPAAKRDFPAGLGIAKTSLGRVYANPDGKTLYMMIARHAQQRGGRGLVLCTGSCAQVWTPLKAAPTDQPMGPWTVITGGQGPQWAYDRNPVFTFNADRHSGETRGQMVDDLWKVIAYVPPKPDLVAPPGVMALLVDGAYVLTTNDGKPLYTRKACPADCVPLTAGFAAGATGEWSVTRGGDAAQWAWRGQPVFVADGTDSLPKCAKALRP